MIVETGPKESSTLSALLEQMNRYEKELHLPELNYEKDEDVDNFLYPKRQWLKGLSASDCNEGSILLEGYAHHLQRVINRCKVVINWAEDCITALIADTVAKEAGYKYEERRAVAVKKNENARRLEALRLEYRTRYNGLEYLPNKYEKQAEFYRELAMTKRKQAG